MEANCEGELPRAPQQICLGPPHFTQVGFTAGSAGSSWSMGAMSVMPQVRPLPMQVKSAQHFCPSSPQVGMALQRPLAQPKSQFMVGEVQMPLEQTSCFFSWLALLQLGPCPQLPVWFMA
jgi:hypothetical protein